MADILYLNGNLIDLPEKPITRKLQVGDVAEVGAIKSSFSYTIDIPATSRNIKILDMLGAQGNASRKPYENVYCDYVEDNISLIRNGKAIIKSKGEKYQINIIDGFKNIEDVLGDSKLNDLDYSAWNHSITLINYVDSLNNTDGFIYALGDFGQGTNTSIKSYFEIEVGTGAIVDTHSLLVELARQPDGAGGRSVETVIGTSGLFNSFFKVQEDSISLNIDVSIVINGTFLAASSTVDLKLKQYRGTGLHSSTTIDTKSGNTSATFTMVQTINQGFTDILEDDYFILSMESSAGSFQSDVSALQQFSVTVEGVMKIETQAPSFFVHTMLQMIFDQNNIDVETDLFLNTEFKKELISISNGYTVSTIGQTINFAGLFDEVNQMDLLKDISFRYGLVLIQKDDKLHLIEIDKIVTGEFGVVDWTKKFSKINSENYTLSSYSKNNNIKYVYPENSPEDKDGVIVIDNQNLSTESDYYTSIFEIANFSESLQTENVYLVPINEIKDGEVENLETPIKLFKLAEYDVNITVRLLTDASSQALTTDVPFLSLTDISLQYYVDNYYNDFNLVLNDFKEVDISINLNTIDIYNLDFSKWVYLKQTGQNYYINSIQYTRGKISKVKLIQV